MKTITLRTITAFAGTFTLALAAVADVPVTPQDVQGAWIFEPGRTPSAYARVNWELSPGAIGYNVFRYDSASNQWNLIASSVSGNFFRDFEAGTFPAYYSVSAVGTDGESAASATVTAQAGDFGSFTVMRPEMWPGHLTTTNALIVWNSTWITGADGMLEFGDSLTNLSLIGFNPAYQYGHGYLVTNLIPASLYYYRITSVGTNRAGLAETYSFTTLDTNHPPVAADVTVGQNAIYWTAVRLSCNDLEGAPTFTFRIVTPPTNGILSDYVIQSSSPQIDVYYLPNPGARGEDHFQYVANDGDLDSAAATATITNIFLNRDPVATSVNTNTPEDTALSLALVATDPDGDALTFVLDGVSYGNAVLDGTNLVYTPAPDFYGEVTVYFHAEDTYWGWGAGTITINVDAVNDPPVADSYPYQTYEDFTLPLYFSGFDVEGDPLTFQVITNPVHGTISGTWPDLVYTPAENYNGPDSFTFVANDGHALSAPTIATITVIPGEDFPSANPASVTLEEDSSTNVVLTATDVDGDPLNFYIVDYPVHGTLSGTAPDVVYTPDANYFGDDSFTFAADDSQGPPGVATVTLTITPVNDAPVALEQSVSTPYNTALSVTLSGADVEGSALSYIVLTQPANGTLTGTAPDLTFTPNIGFSGATSFTFRANDGSLNSATATVSIAVQAATSVPSAPSALTAAAVSSSQINLAWTDNSNNEDGFKIERALNGGSWMQIATVGPNVRAYASTGLTANKTYSYRVRAYNMLGNSAYSNTASAKTLH